MHVHVNGTRLWFDVDRPSLVTEGPDMRARPTVVLVHGGPGSYDHSYFKPDFAPLSKVAQVVYVDLRGHGRSDWGDTEDWSSRCAPTTSARSATPSASSSRSSSATRWEASSPCCTGRVTPGHAGALVLQSTNARFDLARLEVIPGAGHFPWKDDPDLYWRLLSEFVLTATTAPA